MGKRRRGTTGDLFIDPSGQTRLIDKSVEQERLESASVECLGMTFASDDERRQYFRQRLREKLSDKEFRQTAGFPKGTDEDILNLSDPPYYTACPNPFLPDVLSARMPAASTDDYERCPLAADSSGGKNDPIYNAHAYHTKSPWPVIAEYIKHFTAPGDVVLDAFAGAGMTGAAVVAAGHSRIGILAELSPIATFIGSRSTRTPDIDRIQRYASDIVHKLDEEHGWMFRTRHTGWSSGIRDHRGLTASPPRGEGTIHFTLWSDVLVCPHCGREIVYWHECVDYDAEGLRDKFPCPGCGARIGKDDAPRATEVVWDSLLKAQRTRSKQVPVLINYQVGSQRFEKFPDSNDLERIAKIEHLVPGPSTPVAKMMFKDPPWGDMYRAGYHAGMTHVHHFYWWRSLIVLADASALTSHDADLRYWFTSTLPWCSRENRLSVGNYFGKKGGVITTYRGAIYIASLGIETNPIERLRHRVDSAIIPTPDTNARVFVSTQSSVQLKTIPDSSIDYVFIDPPFGGNLIYSELNFLWESWLGVWTNSETEAILSACQHKDLATYEALIRQVLKELHRVLKPGRWVTVQFHNSQNAVWIAIQTALFEAGFVVADVRTMDKGKPSFKQVVAAGAVKKDLVISAYKPSVEPATRGELGEVGEESAWAFVRSHLGKLPTYVGSADGQTETIIERQRHLLYDRMIAFHVQRALGLPVSFADFCIGLQQRFPEREGMYFLSEQVSDFDKKRALSSGMKQFELMVVDEATAIQWIRQLLQRKPHTFQELQPLFMREAQSWQKHEVAIELRRLLEENFLVYDGAGVLPGQIHAYLSSNYKELRNRDKNDAELREKSKDRWYVPDANKQADLEKLRDRALLREFGEYVASKQRKLKQFRGEAIRAGFRAAYEAGDYGRIVAVTAKLPEAVIQEDEKLLMYYDVASMRLGEE